MWYYCFLISIFICVLSCTICINSTVLHHRLGQTCIWPRPPRLHQPDPDRWILQQRISRISEDLIDVIVEDGQTGVVRQTSVDSCEPVDSFSVNLVTRRLVYKSVLTARLCSFHNEQSIYLNQAARLIKHKTDRQTDRQTDGLCIKHNYPVLCNS